MRFTQNSKIRSDRHSIRAVGVAAVLGMVALAGCSDEQSAQEKYCEAGDSLRTNIESLADLDLIAGGTDGLNDAVGLVRDDLDELRDAASDATADEVETFEQSVEDLETAVSALSGDLTSENATALGTAVQDVATAAQAVIGTLGDC